MNRESHVVDCPTCRAAVAAEVIAKDREWDGDEEETPIQHVFLVCPRCRGAFLAMREGTAGSSWGSGDTYVEWKALRVLYPADRRTLDSSVPGAIASSFQEALTCLQAGAHTAAAIMCRRTMEGICANHGVTKGPLQKRLEKLRDDGAIESRLFDWSEALRVAGNEAAHDVNDTISREDAQDLTEFCRALIEYIFTFAAHYQRFQERRAGRVREEDAPFG